MSKINYVRITFITQITCLAALLFIPLALHAAMSDKGKDILLTQSQLEEYNAEGMLVIKGFFTQEEVKQVSQCADLLQKEAETLSLQQTGKVMHKGTQFVIDRNANKLQIHRIVWVGAAEPQLLQLARQPKLLVPVAQILGSDQADQLINQLHYKLPSDGVKFDWHQDVKNRRTFDPNWEDLNHKGSFVQTIIAIDPNTMENGCMYYVPKSHMRGDLYLDKISDPLELQKVAELDNAVPLTLGTGDIVFMHPYLVHGSQPNESAKPRRIFINGFSYPGANKQLYPGEGSAQRIALNKNRAISIHVPSNWTKFEEILLARYEQPQTKMKLSHEQLNSFINFLDNLKQPTPELLKLLATLPKTTLELMRAIESRGVTLAEAEQMALYLYTVPEKFAIKNIAAFDENTSHIIGREWSEIDYGGEGMTWEKQQQKYKPHGITNFKSLENLTKFFPVESKLPYFIKVYG